MAPTTSTTRSISAAALVPEDDPSSPAFAQLISTFTDPVSDGGATVTMDEFSVLVEEITWEGGPAVEDPRALVPALDALQDLEDAGADAEGDVLADMRRFILAQLLPTATYPSLFFDRGADGRLLGAIEEAAASATVYYSTDGWDLPHVVDCPRQPDGDLACDFGAIPPGALIFYSIVLHHDDGSASWIHSVTGNFFHELPQ